MNDKGEVEVELRPPRCRDVAEQMFGEMFSFASTPSTRRMRRLMR